MKYHCAGARAKRPIAGFRRTPRQFVFRIAGNLLINRESRRVVVPNLGRFAALSYRFTNAKISAGYLADFFFGAMDGGLDTHRSVTTAFHGPFAKISVGLGG